MCNYISNYLKQVKLIAATWCMRIWSRCNERKKMCERARLLVSVCVFPVRIWFGMAWHGIVWPKLCICMCGAVELANPKNM